MQTPTGAPTPVAICCANRLFRDALAAALSGRHPEFTVVGDVGDPGDLPSLCRLRAPELVLCCAGNALGSALSALSAVRVQCTRSRLVLIYQELSRADLIATRRAGVDTLIPCSHGLDALVRVLGGQHPGAPPAGRVPGPPEAAATALTDVEQEIVALLAAGHPVGRIACLLGIGTRTVENHKRRIYQKLAVSGQNQLVARVTTLGLAGRPPVAPHRADRPVELPLVVLRGASGSVRNDIETALLAARVPFVSGLPDARDGAKTCPDTRPRIMVVVDPVLGDWIRMARPGATTLLVRSVPMSREEVLAALRHGVVGVVATHQVTTVLVPALQLAAAGHLTLEAFTGAALATAGAGWGGTEGLPELTVREADILRSIARGHTVRQTARSLDIAVKTVENTQARLFRKLGARNRAGALATAHALGLLELLD